MVWNRLFQRCYICSSFSIFNICEAKLWYCHVKLCTTQHNFLGMLHYLINLLICVLLVLQQTLWLLTKSGIYVAMGMKMIWFYPSNPCGMWRLIIKSSPGCTDVVQLNINCIGGSERVVRLDAYWMFFTRKGSRPGSGNQSQALNALLLSDIHCKWRTSEQSFTGMVSFDLDLGGVCCKIIATCRGSCLLWHVMFCPFANSQ